jgi:UDP-N-acetylglucosamine--N-acetylmuramyl-(pentapeptide) pyrophosphoryl-undecaprenol N-acetylglucosamine transferase
VYPALAVRQALGEDAQPVLWVGGEGGMEADLVTRSGLPFAAIPAAGVHGVGLKALPGNVARLVKGVAAARRILKEFRPEVILYTGGYVAVPMAVAAGKRIPSLVYVPDLEPGLALKTLAYFAHTIALTAEPGRAYFSSRARAVVTGYPVRADLSGWSKSQARAHLGLSEDRPVLLVTGGSKGARSINRAILANLPQLLQIADVLHLTGPLDWAEVEVARAGLPEALRVHYHARPYLHEMGAALAAADLVVSRAGASSLGEYPMFGLPAILAPYPYAWRYQKVNADYLVKAGAALLLEDEALGEQLFPLAEGLLNNPARLAQMRAAMSGLAQPGAAQRIADLVRELAGQIPHGGQA